MGRQSDEEVLDLALMAGHILLENGAEIYRVEETIDRICGYYGVNSENAFVLSNGIFLTAGSARESFFAKVQHIPVSGTHLNKVAAVNQLSREIVEGKHTIQDAYRILEEIRTMPGKKRWIIPTCCGVSALCLAMLLNAWSFWWGSGAVTVLNVGQGQSVLVRSGRFLCLVDCGGDSYDNAGDIAADFLGDYGVGRLDLLVLTHFHADHANGVTELLKRVQVDTLAIPPATGEEEPLRDEILSVAEVRDVEVLEVGEDTLLTLDDDRTIQLYAPLGAGETNEAGLTCLISTGDFDTLITGDMGADVEQQLLAHTDLPDLEVLVAGHHGSKSSTSEQLLAATAPDYAFLSVGEHNTYGHPAQETLERLAAAGCRIYRTDLQGTITLRIGAAVETERSDSQ